MLITSNMMRIIVVTVIVTISCALSEISLEELLSYRNRYDYGGVAKPKQFPWHVFLESWTKNFSIRECGGSIISNDWVLTAGHCVFNMSSIDLYFGSTERLHMPVKMVSKTWILHEDYDDVAVTNDIAVVKLPEPLTYTDTIQPVQLLSLSQAKSDLNTQITSIAGFGYTSDINTEIPKSLIYTQLQVITNTQCRKKFPERVIISSSLCCLGHPNSYQSICYGDSGSALLMKDGNTFSQIGIASFIYENGCTVGDPSVFARVGSFLPWIHEHTAVALRP